MEWRKIFEAFLSRYKGRRSVVRDVLHHAYTINRNPGQSIDSGLSRICPNDIQFGCPLHNWNVSGKQKKIWGLVLPLLSC